MKSKVRFIDLSYSEKRQKYREFSRENGFAYEMKLYVLDNVLRGKKRNILLNIDIEEMINNLLVDGCVAYERIFDKNDNIIAYNAIDPISLTLDVRNAKWIQHEDNPNIKRFLNAEQILYIKYPIIDANDSLIGQIYTKQFKLYNSNKLNDFMLTYICSKLHKYLIDIIKKEKVFFKNNI
jgi:hypothetical protein